MAADNSYAGHLEKLAALVAPAGTTLVEVFGVGPVIAAAAMSELPLSTARTGAIAALVN